MQEKFDKEKILAQKQELLSTVKIMQELLEQYYKELEKIGSGSSIYQSENATNVQTSFNRDYQKFKELLNTITKTVEFLEPIASIYENLDQQISNQIAAFPEIDGGKI